MFLFCYILFFSWQAKQDGQQSRVEIWSKDARGVSDTYLEELAKHWTKNAKVKHEAKLCVCSSWFLLHLSSLGTKEHCDEAGVMYVAPCFFYFFPTKGKWTTNTREMHEGLCFWICCSHPCFNRNSNSKDLFGTDPKVLATILLLFFWERNLGRDFFLLLTIF